MNTKLVESLVQIIQSLSDEERKVFEDKLFFDTHEVTSQELMNLADKSRSFDFLQDEPDLFDTPTDKSLIVSGDSYLIDT